MAVMLIENRQDGMDGWVARQSLRSKPTKQSLSIIERGLHKARGAWEGGVERGEGGQGRVTFASHGEIEQESHSLQESMKRAAKGRGGLACAFGNKAS